MLKELHHPGIPIVYDIEEDEEYSYLVEEYLQGDSLDSLVSRQGPLTRCTVLQYALQLCSVVHYLHSAGTEPILHLDLQPKNLLVCHGNLKLIDFGQADRLTQANRAGQRFGTVGFAAPEQYCCDQVLDERTDIYAIGGLLFYLTVGEYPDTGLPPAMFGLRMWNREAGRVIAACLAPKKEDRYSSVSQLREDLEKLPDTPALSRIVAVYGNEPRIGTTHISLGLCAYLWRQGIPNLYEEAHPCRHLHELQRAGDCRVDSYGIFLRFGCAFKPWYGRQIRFLAHGYPVVIQDRGLWSERKNPVPKASEADVTLLIVGGKWWNRPPSPEFASVCAKSGLMIYNFSDKAIRLSPPKGFPGERVLRAPLFANPFSPEKAAGEWLEMLWGWVKTQGKEGLEQGKKQEKRTKKQWKGGSIWAGKFCIREWMRAVFRRKR